MTRLSPALSRLTSICLFTSFCLWVVPAVAEESVDFNRDIRSLMSNNCLMCHGPDENERAVGLRLDTEEGSREDLGGYAAVVPGDPDSSALLERIASDDDDVRMPPPGKGRKLTAAEVEVFRRWIAQGGKYDTHWSYRLPVRPKLPTINQRDWPRNPIDHFVLAKLESAGLQPSPPADRLAIARRVALDLTGLPPTWEEAQAFAEDQDENAYDAYVDRLLAKQSYGERWARVWLDLARYADSAGYADDPPRTIWAYRDYVIRSLNENKPFDQFTIEQIAGDLLENPTQDQLIATAFHRNTLTNNEGGTNDEEFRNVAVVDRVNTTMAVWMGTTMACAQCHTHKYDPITHDEYFQFFAFFNSSEDTDRKDESPTIEIWSDEQKSRKKTLQQQVADLKEELSQPSKELDAAQENWLAGLTQKPEWQPIKPTAVEATGRELSIADDGWVAASGEKPDTDTYTLRFDSIDGDLTGLRLEVPAEQKDNFVVSQIQADWLPSGDHGRSIDARFLRVELPGSGKMIHLAEIQAFSDGQNIATTGKATQSSTDYGGKVQYVNDGNTNGDFNAKSVSHTATEKDPWVEIDLEKIRSIQRIVIWNRTDGGAGITNRLKGYQVLLLDESRNVVWQQQPEKVPSPSEEFALTGQRTIRFVAASADWEQKGFPAESVVQAKIDPKTGWAVAPRTGKPHELTLLTDGAVDLADGVLTLQIRQESAHASHLLDRFRISRTGDASVSTWAKMPVDVRKIVSKDPASWKDPQQIRVAEYFRSITPLLNSQRKELQSKEKALAALKPTTTVPVMRDLPTDKRRQSHVQIRGNYLSKGNQVSEGTPAAFHALPDDLPPNRLALARWLIDDSNPLTARVIANRHWEQVFGTGIVETSEEFGSQGELPSHPELLDWMAVELRDSGWDIKRFLKLIVTSATYRQSSVTTADAIAADPFNRMLARGPRFRISAEMVRDQALFVSGLLSDKMFGNPVNPPQPELGLKAAFGSATDWKTSLGADKYRRGIYTTWRRSSPYPSMAQFDAPNREVCTVRRIRTNTPLQALVTLNDPVYVEAAQALARRMIDASGSPAERVQFGIRNSLIRNATDREVSRLTQLADDAYKQFLTQSEKASQMATIPLGGLPETADVAEYAAWTLVGNVILNLDEIFMKR
ncbi:MAG: DUF1553 domain-containing protein [Pirellulaceae bacterium]|nr:DUF1553 domain-containing protein [Pirellulaceae bacterium]